MSAAVGGATPPTAAQDSGVHLSVVLDGVIVDPSTEEGISGAKVELTALFTAFDLGPKKVTAVSGNCGNFSVGLRPGIYTVEVVRPRYDRYQTVITLATDREVQWALQRQTPPDPNDETFDMGWYVQGYWGENPRDLDTLDPKAVDTVVMYSNAWINDDPAQPSMCNNFDVEEALADLPDGVDAWVGTASAYFIEAYHDCRVEEENCGPHGCFGMLPDWLYCNARLPRVRGDRQTCTDIYLEGINPDQSEGAPPILTGAVGPALDRMLSFADSHKIRGFYIFDEPDTTPSNPVPGGFRDTAYPPYVLDEIAQFVRQRTGLPTLGVMGGTIAGHLDFFESSRQIPDTIGWDFYPKWDEPVCWPPGWQQTDIIVDLLAEYGRDSYYVGQGQGPSSGFGFRSLSFDEIRYSAWAPLIRGVRGTIFWWYPHSDEDLIDGGAMTIRAATHQVFRQIRSLNAERILFEGAPSTDYTYEIQGRGIGTTPPNTCTAFDGARLCRMHSALRFFDDDWYLMVAAAPDQDREVTFNIDIGDPAGKWLVQELITNRLLVPSVAGSQVEFTDLLPRGGVRVYRLEKCELGPEFCIPE